MIRPKIEQRSKLRCGNGRMTSTPEDLPGVCGLFAENVVLAYPGGGNRGWDAVCDRMRGLFDNPAKKFTGQRCGGP